MGDNGHVEGVSAHKLSVRERLLIHLTCNFFPPLNPKCIPYLEEAIEAVNSGDGEKAIVFPSGTEFPASKIIDELRLEDFID